MTTLQQKWESIKVFIDQNNVSPEDLAEEVLQDKLRFQKVSLDQTIELIRERETTKQRNVSSIESEIIQVQKDLFPHKCIRYPIMPDSRRKGSLEKALSDLEDRRRDEVTDCWKDTLKLWQNIVGTR